MQEETIRWMMIAVSGLFNIIAWLIVLKLAKLIYRIWFMLHPNRKSEKDFGVFCGHCGRIMTHLPDRMVALTDKSYYVYACPTCRNETLIEN